MTSHPSDPPAPWPPPSPEERPAGRGQRPGAPEEWPAAPRQRHPADQPGNGHRAAATYPAHGTPPPPADYPPETAYRPAPGHPAGPGSGPGGYPDLPDYPQDTYSPREPYFSGYPSMPDYPPTPDYPAAAGNQPAGYPANGYPAGAYPAGAYPANGHPPEAYPMTGQPPGGSQVVEFPAAGGGWALAAAPVSHEEYLHPGSVAAAGPDALRARPGRTGPATPGAVADAAGPPDVGWAMLGYLTVPFFGFLLPLAVYLTSLRRSRWLRVHAAQAVNVWLTVTLYELSAAIIGAVLVLDSPRVALTVVVPLVAALWLTALAFLVRAAAAARRGRAYTFPRWLCTPLVR
jgi:uncharacterized Tic20 family protein